MTTTPHRHTYRLEQYSLDTITYWCCRCENRITLDISRDREWRKVYRREFASMQRSVRQLHATWHAFCKKFKHPDTEEYLYQGWDLMTRVEKWAKNRKGIKLLHVDDAHFASSLLVLIEHRSQYEWMGLKAIVISQCTPAPPVEFFLYPRDADGLFRALSPKLYRKDTEWDRRVSPELRELHKKAAQLFRGRRKNRET